jgi:GTP:adenosylcobinamide-phosphate guanylyltransferase
MDALIVAGGKPGPEDDLYPYTQGEPKALIPMGARTMLERVIDALQSSNQVGEMVVVGIGHDHGMTFKRPIHHLPDQGSMVANAIAGMKWLVEYDPTPRPVLGVSADIPTLTGEIVDELINTCQPFQHTLYYTVVTPEVMEKRFPASNRTYVRFHNTSVAGGDMFIMHTSLLKTDPQLLEAFTNARKHAWKLARLVGFETLLKFLFRRLTLKEVEQAGERVLNSPVKVIIFPHAEIAMDADKPNQVELLQAEFYP